MINNQFRILIVDDEPDARNLLKSLLSDINYVHVVDEADNAENALYKIVEYYPDLVFMDINMPGKSGMELIELLHSRNVDVPVVFVSAYEEYAIKAIRNQVYDFLLKPVEQENLIAIVEKYKRLNKKDLPGKLMEVLDSIKESSKIRINSRHTYVLINPDEIVYCDAEDGYTNLYLITGNYYRLGRSLLINLDHVRSISKATDSVLLQYNEQKWEVFASHKSIKELLKSNYSYA